MNHTPESLIRYLYQCYREGRLGDFAQFIDPECEWVFPGDPRVLPWAGTFRGQEIFEFARRIVGSIRYEQFQDEAYYPSGDHVVVILRERCRVLATNRTFENQIAALATVRDGRLVRYVEYSDTGAMERAFETIT